MKRTVVRNIGLIASPEGRSAKGGAEQGQIKMLRDAYLLIEDGVIAKVGEGNPAEGEMEGATVIDAEGKLVTPGLVDAHTHLVFGGWRQHEMEQKLKGATYLEILAAGGGILSTVTATRNATEEELANKAAELVGEMMRCGTTTCEVKSGYGLNEETELKQLRAIARANQMTPVEMVATFMGAHAVPTEYKEDREAYIDLICNSMIPRVAEERLAEFCDVFCERGVFTADESARILESGAKFGLIPKIHADEIESIGGTRVAGEVGAISAEHLITCTNEGIEALKEGGTIACLLPCTSLYLGATFAPARDMIAAGVPVAIATDFNPGSCPCGNIQLAMNLGCLKYRMTPEEVLTAVTLNGAAAINRAETLGSIEEGKQADLIIWNAEDLNYIMYRMGSNLVGKVMKKGEIYE